MSGSKLIDRSDERLQHGAGLGGAIRGFFDRVRSGDLGSLPVVIGLLIICSVFETLNPVFLSSGNIVDLLYDSSTIGVISLGIVCILMVGEIDLSVGSVSGFASAMVGVLWVNHGVPVWVAIIAAALAGAIFGGIYSLLFNRFGMPSFVSTLSGLLAILGLQLYILGETGSINLPYGSAVVSFGQSAFMPPILSYVLALAAGVFLLFNGVAKARRRRLANLSASSLTILVVRAFLITAVLVGAVYYLDHNRGVPWMLGLFVCLVLILDYALTRTRWGRCMSAVGGNREAERF